MPKEAKPAPASAADQRTIEQIHADFIKVVAAQTGRSILELNSFVSQADETTKTKFFSASSSSVALQILVEHFSNKAKAAVDLDPVVPPPNPSPDV